MPSTPKLNIEVAYATVERAWVESLTVDAGCTIAQAIAQAMAQAIAQSDVQSGVQSGVQSVLSDIDLATQAVGVHGEKQNLEHMLKDGDRVEIYRPLSISPTEARRLRAQKRLRDKAAQSS